MPWILTRLIIRELIGPWLFGVVLFTVLLLAGTYLFRLTNLFVSGIDIRTVLELSAMYMPALIVKTLPMAVLLASLLAFMRLSNDSEVVAAVAAGASLFTIMRPVALFGLAVSGITFVFGEYVVPPATFRATELQLQVSQSLKQAKAGSIYQPLYVKDKFRGSLMAREANFGTSEMYDVTGVWFDENNQPEMWFHAKKLYYSPGKEWRMQNVQVWRTTPEGDTVTTFIGDTRPLPGTTFDFTPKDFLTRNLDSPDALSMADLADQLERLKKNPRMNQDKIREWEVGYWLKIALPLTALVFGLVGAPVAIRNSRQSMGVGFSMSILIIFLYYTAQQYMMIMAKRAVIEPAVAAFAPVALGLAAAFMLFWNRNR